MIITSKCVRFLHVQVDVGSVGAHKKKKKNTAVAISVLDKEKSAPSFSRFDP